MFSKKKVVLCLIVIFAAGLVALAQLVRLPESVTQAPGDIVCSPYILTEFTDGVLLIKCQEDKGPRNMSFKVLPNNTPSPDTLLSYINPYVIATSQLSVLPEMSTHMNYWNRRIAIYYDGSKKITGIRYQVGN